jgi:hypothetical protein
MVAPMALAAWKVLPSRLLKTAILGNKNQIVAWGRRQLGQCSERRRRD